MSSGAGQTSPVVVAALAALGAAVLYAVASVLQQREASRQPPELALHVRLVVELAKRPAWVAGNVADLAGYGLHFMALRSGSLVLVQPILVTGLLFALPLGAWLDRTRITAWQMAGSTAIVAGLGLFLVLSRPRGPHGHATAAAWIAVFALSFAAVAILVGASSRAAPAVRAAVLGAAAGILFAVTAALTEAAGRLMRHGALEVVGHWQLYALIAVGIANIVVAQTAFQAGPIAWSLPALTVVDPVVSVAIGGLAFHETAVTHVGTAAGEALAIVVMALGVVAVTRDSSP